VKLVNFEKEGLVRAGIVKDGKVYDIAAEAERLGIKSLKAVMSVDQLLEDSLVDDAQKNGAKLTSGKGVALKSVKLRSPVLYPEKIIMVAVNYSSHGAETNTPLPEYPYLFTKFRSSIVDPEGPVLAPKVSKKVDWEVELAVVIGKEGKNIRKDKALDYVAGYTVSNDVSFRDFQSQRNERLGMNWVKGKAMDASLPLGPWLVTKDEIPDPQKLALSLTVNGKRQQNSNTSGMLFKVDDLVSYASIGITLRPGDIISTGTPDGIAAATGEPFLQDGDVMEATVERIGTLRNRVKRER
jgi:2-keto-4-pentenoate hydratase/2-oxohepta-3-ene-1,7-dioic acid hydratase in catechol pathway